MVVGNGSFIWPEVLFFYTSNCGCFTVPQSLGMVKGKFCHCLTADERCEREVEVIIR